MPSSCPIHQKQSRHQNKEKSHSLTHRSLSSKLVIKAKKNQSPRWTSILSCAQASSRSPQFANRYWISRSKHHRTSPVVDEWITGQPGSRHRREIFLENERALLRDLNFQVKRTSFANLRFAVFTQVIQLDLFQNICVMHYTAQQLEAAMNGFFIEKVSTWFFAKVKRWMDLWIRSVESDSRFALLSNSWSTRRDTSPSE